jgi:hypothetical protein
LTTPLHIITDALEKLGVYAPGETISDSDSFRSRHALSDLVDQWQDDSIYLYQLIPIPIFLQVGTQSYTVGPGGTIAGPRPARILQGPMTGSVTINSVTTPVDSVSALEWNAIYNTLTSDFSVPSGTPTTVYYDPQSPLGFLSFFPQPDTPGTASVSGYFGLYGFPASLTQPDVTFVPGQRLALSSNLACLLHSYFAMGNLTPDLLSQAQQSKTTLTLTNRLSRAMSARNVAPQTPVVPKP